MTFNIRCSNAHDGWNGWPNRRDLLVDVIRRFNGDVVGLQEARPDQVAYLREKLPGYACLAVSREAAPEEGEATPLLYRKSRWKADPAEQGTFWLSDTPQVAGSRTWGNGCPRIVTWARITDVTTGRGVYVYNTHFDHLSETSRLKSAALLALRIADRTRPDPVIVTGDLNCLETNRAVCYLTGQVSDSPVKLVDAYRAVHPDVENAGTFHGFYGGQKGWKIDYIFASRGTQILAAEIVRENQDGRYPSDHYPLTVRMRLPAETPSGPSRSVAPAGQGRAGGQKKVPG